jgi:hypothetical protein
MHGGQQLNDSASHGTTTANLSFDGSTRDIYDMDSYDNVSCRQQDKSANILSAVTKYGSIIHRPCSAHAIS